MGATRIQTKSRGTKKPMVLADFDINGSAITYNKVIARKPRLDKRGYPETAGLPIPVLAQGLIVDTTP